MPAASVGGRAPVMDTAYAINVTAARSKLIRYLAIKDHTIGYIYLPSFYEDWTTL